MMEYSILLVEDDVDGREVLIKLLHRSGYRVRGAGTVKDALAILRQEDFDLLIADIGLPDGTGIELMCEARNMRPSLTGVALTGFDEHSFADACKEAGFGEFLLKPIAFEKLKGVIARLANQKYLVRQPISHPSPASPS
jgi:DNA-binding NtrC family response regulator